MSMSVFGFDSVYQLIQIISIFGQILICDLIFDGALHLDNALGNRQM